VRAFVFPSAERRVCDAPLAAGEGLQCIHSRPSIRLLCFPFFVLAASPLRVRRPFLFSSSSALCVVSSPCLRAVPCSSICRRTLTEDQRLPPI